MYFAWVKSSDIAPVSRSFIKEWQSAAKKSLAAITKTGVSILNKQRNFQFKGYIGGVFPLVKQDEETASILIPVKNDHLQQGVIRLGKVSSQAVARMPMVASKKNIVKLIEQLQNRPLWVGRRLLF